MSSLAERIKRIAFWGQRCKCGCLYEDHSHQDDRCPWFPGMKLVTDDPSRFTLEDRMSFDEAWYDATHRYCSFEIPNYCFGCVEVTICGRQIPASSDPCVDFCFKHLTEGVGQ